MIFFRFGNSMYVLFRTWKSIEHHSRMVLEDAVHCWCLPTLTSFSIQQMGWMQTFGGSLGNLQGGDSGDSLRTWALRIRVKMRSQNQKIRRSECRVVKHSSFTRILSSFSCINMCDHHDIIIIAWFNIFLDQFWVIRCFFHYFSRRENRMLYRWTYV